MKRTNATSALHGHSLSVQFENEKPDTETCYSLTNQDIVQDFEDTCPDLGRANHPLVTQLLLEAKHHVKPDADNYPWMPWPRTSLLEATKYLASNGSIGIQSGAIFWNKDASVFSCVAIGCREHVVLNWQEVIDLLRANYKIL
jgi:hypothetical protein